MTRFVVIGDAILDVTVAPSRPVREGGDVSAVIRLGPGGQGANVAVRLARRGELVTLGAPIAGDVGGRLLGEAIAAAGVGMAPTPATRTAVVVALLDAGGERSMLSDRQTLDARRIDETVGAADWIHVSAYALIDDLAGDALAETLGARGAGVRLSLAGGSIAPEPAVVTRFLARVRRARPDVLVVSREEAAALLGKPAQLAREASRDLGDLAELVVVTAAGLGSAASHAGASCEVAAADVAGPVLDSTGAGDGYVAGLISTLAGGEWPPSGEALREAMQAGSHAGALVARVIGAQTPIDGEGTAPQAPAR